MAGSDASAFVEMGGQILVNGTPVRAICQPGELQSQLGDGGFGISRSTKFEVSESDVALYGIKTGAKVTVQTPAGEVSWRVAAMRDQGATVELMCIETAGRCNAEF